MSDQPWWQSAVFYQIYPRSFADGNGDGIGDLWGALDKLDYLEWLGIDAVWISPHYPSPQADIGYDVSDYVDVNPEYGDLALFDRFLAEAHRRGIRVLVDLVINHSSDQHPWFLESRSSADNPKADWYVWHPGVVAADGTRQPPNNWISPFGGPAWTWDEVRGEYFYHYFLAEQPDLNWHNPDLAAAMWDAVRFWLDRGVDGFRIDALGTIFEDPEMADHTSPYTLADLIDLRFAPGSIAGDPGELWDALAGGQRDLPEVHDVMKGLRLVLEEYDDRVLVGETGELAYHGDGTDELQLVFNFPLADVRELTPEFVRDNQRKRLPAIPDGAWPCNTFNNHDRDRIRSSGIERQDDTVRGAREYRPKACGEKGKTH